MDGYSEPDLVVEVSEEEFQLHIKKFVMVYEELNPTKLCIGSEAEKLQSFTEFRNAYKKLMLESHPDKSNKNDFLELCKSVNTTKYLIDQLYTNNHSRYSSDTTLVEIVNLLCNLRDLKGKLDNSFLQVPWSKDSLIRLIHKQEKDNKKKQNQDILRKQQEESAKLQLISDSRTLIRLQIENFTKDFFISSEVSAKTPYAGPQPECSLKNCSSNSNLFVILPCCNTLVKTDCLVDSIYNEITQHGCRDKLLAISTATFFQIEMTCPLCKYDWLDAPLEIKRYSISDNIIKSRNDLYFNVFFLIKNQRRNDKIKFDNEVNNLLNENNDLSNKLNHLADYCKERESGLVQLQSQSHSPSLEDSIHETTTSLDSIHETTDNDISMMSNSDLNDSGTYYEPQHNSYDDLHEQQSINQNNFSEERNDNEPVLNVMNPKNLKEFAYMIINEMKTCETKSKLNKIKFYPTICHQTEQKIRLRCPFFPACNKELELCKSFAGNSIIHGGKDQNKFRHHKCNGINKEKIFITLKKISF